MALDRRLPASAYGPQVSDVVYGICRKRAALALAAGRSVIVDAVHARPDERVAVAAVAAEFGVDFIGLWLDAPAAVMQERVARRVGDVSDATAQVVESQLDYDLGTMEFCRIDASGPLDAVAAACRARIAAKA